MSKEIKNILKEASSIINRLEEGQSYPINYVVARLEKAAEKHPTDQLIGNMRDVLSKVASNKEFINQKEIGSLYDRMYGLSGGHTGFRESLGDLLPDSRQFAKVAYPGSNLRTMEEKNVQPLHKESELSNAFSVLFSLGGDSSFGTFKPGKDKSIQKAVMAKLSGLGHTPEGVDVVHANEHFALCSANYKTTGMKKASALIPVQISDGVTKEPNLIILGGETVNLDSTSLYTAIRESEKDGNDRANRKFASERGTGESILEEKQVALPAGFEDLERLESSLVAAASKFSTSQVNMAINTLSAELSSFNIPRADIKVASSNERGLILSADIPTRLGKSRIEVPVEIKGPAIMLPRKFATKATSKEEVIFDFSKEGFERFADSLSSTHQSVKIARDEGPLGSMSYQQLMDKMIDGVATKDYKIAEDVLDVIGKRFGSDKFAVAFEQFTQLLKHSSDTSIRKQMIKEAYDRGDLIKVPTSVELYCPKLGLPVSKVTFDEKGRVIPAARRNKAENHVQDAMMSTNRIIFT
jgi:hypothetical protein